MNYPIDVSKPLRSVSQFAGEPDAPFHYMENIRGPLHALQSELYWHFQDLCYFHHITYADLKRRLDFLAEEHQRFTQYILEEEQKVDEGDREAFRVYESRTRTNFMDRDIELERAKSFADEYSIIGLWAMAERFLGKCYASIVAQRDSVPSDTVKRPYKWKNFKTAYKTFMIDLPTLHDYDNANECRTLNNAIKHFELVSDPLAGFTYWSAHRGMKISEVQIEMQRYATGVYNFCGALIEAGNKHLDPTFAV
ncbi:hypothetical protein [Roseiconus lacunae]|uniref:hypothetical protein n=1 Tax=Roseiconus lacunae TaxID=2605694 RepID=UPI001E3C4930|nr:hypothetical protein [Roseiconus lacunae]MCD0457844.1 hypothetical protein [Roseiconus lacunae]